MYDYRFSSVVKHLPCMKGALGITIRYHKNKEGKERNFPISAILVHFNLIFLNNYFLSVVVVLIISALESIFKNILEKKFLYYLLFFSFLPIEIYQRNQLMKIIPLLPCYCVSVTQNKLIHSFLQVTL